MGAVLLLVPAGADLDHAIRGVAAVANDKMVAEFIPTLVAVEPVEATCASVRCGAVMDDDGGPSRADLPAARIPSRVAGRGTTRHAFGRLFPLSGRGLADLIRRGTHRARLPAVRGASGSERDH